MAQEIPTPTRFPAPLDREAPAWRNRGFSLHDGTTAGLFGYD